MRALFLIGAERQANQAMIRELRYQSTFVILYEDEYSRRIRIDDYEGNPKDVVRLITEATPSWTEKVIIKSRPDDVLTFSRQGFTEEAIVRGYFAGVDMHFVVRYLSNQRSYSAKAADEDTIIKEVLATPAVSMPSTSLVQRATMVDAEQLASLYNMLFTVYPTPVGDPDHVKKTMEEGTVYMIIREGETIVSAASAEINQRYRNAELTDCATLDSVQGKGYMRMLLFELEQYLRKRDITCCYTIARAESFGMNKAFHSLGYTYGGRMTKNCMIYSGMEDMNVWYKN